MLGGRFSGAITVTCNQCQGYMTEIVFVSSIPLIHIIFGMKRSLIGREHVIDSAWNAVIWVRFCCYRFSVPIQFANTQPYPLLQRLNLSNKSLALSAFCLSPLDATLGLLLPGAARGGKRVGAGSSVAGDCGAVVGVDPQFF